MQKGQQYSTNIPCFISPMDSILLQQLIHVFPAHVVVLPQIL